MTEKTVVLHQQTEGVLGEGFVNLEGRWDGKRRRYRRGGNGRVGDVGSGKAELIPSRHRRSSWRSSTLSHLCE